MRQTIVVTIAIFFVGCASTQPTANEQLFEAVKHMEETNSTGVMYQQRQSHGLLGDLIESAGDLIIH